MRELYAYPIQKARQSDPKYAFYPIQRPFSRSEWDSKIVSRPIKIATCNELQVAINVEAGGIEPPSCEPSVSASTCVDY